MPVKAFGGYYTSGYGGTGPSEFEYAVTARLADATTNLAAARQKLPARAELHRLICGQQAPLHITFEPETR